MAGSRLAPGGCSRDSREVKVRGAGVKQVSFGFRGKTRVVRRKDRKGWFVWKARLRGLPAGPQRVKIRIVFSDGRQAKRTSATVFVCARPKPNFTG